MKSAPLYAILAYIVLSFSLILFGPVTYFGFNPVLTSLFLGAVMFAMTAGYQIGLSTFDRAEAAGRTTLKAAFSIMPLFKVCLGLAILGLMVSVGQAVLGGTLNLSVAEVGQAYVDEYAGYERNTGNYSVTFIIYSLTLPPTFIASIWGLYYFKRLPSFLKASVLFLILGTLLFYTIGSGKQKQLGDTIIFTVTVVAIAYARSGRAINLRFMLMSSLAGLLAFAGFISILGQRYAASSIDALNITFKSHPLQSFNLDHPIFVIFGYDIGFAIAVFTGYLSGGYFGLSLALETEPTWSYMIGFSYSLGVLVNRLTGLPWVIDYTYPYIVGSETGWGASKWHSIFPHWASDFTFPGTVILFGFFAFIYARTWRESVKHENPFGILLFSMLTMGAFFIPANNQLFISPGGLANVIVIVIMYVIYHKRFNVPSARSLR